MLTLDEQNAPTAEENTMGSTDGKASQPPVKSTFGTGLIILFVAQILSAIMGLYTEETYKKYGPQWKENLFYSHLLSLPLFLPFAPSLISQFSRLAHSPPLVLPGFGGSVDVDGQVATPGGLRVPSQLAYLVINVLTQYACIRGVNLLAAASTALTVTIVLNIRKLVSLLLSIWLFGNRLAAGTMLGAFVVFGAGGLYSLDSGKKARPQQQKKEDDEIELK
jgi:UDP-xylose/UDP-N-acetylglucosamine transporter B4